MEHRNITVRLVALLLLVSATASAAPLPALAAAPSDPADPAALEAFFDTWVADQLESRHVPGAVVVTVYGRQTLFAKGYGLFVAYSGVAAMLQEKTLTALVGHFDPGPETPPLLPRDDTAAGVAGLYRSVRSGYTNVEKALGLLSYTRVTALTQGTLQVAGPLGPETYEELEPFVYRKGETGDLLVFAADSRGKARLAFDGALPIAALERYPWYEQPVMVQAALAASGLILISVLIAALVRLLRRRRRQAVPSESTQVAGRALTVASALTVIFIALFIVAFSNQLAFTQGIVTYLKPALMCSTALVILARPIAARTIPVCRSGLSFGRRLHYTLGAVALLATSWSFLTWNLVGWRF